MEYIRRLKTEEETRDISDAKVLKHEAKECFYKPINQTVRIPIYVRCL